MRVRTRFAPSPTGLQHMGNIRTAVFSWLWARHNRGDFIVRIEDTDRQRLVPGTVRAILEELQWCGLDIDEGPSSEDLHTIGEWWEGAPRLRGHAGSYVQSLRRVKYQAAAQMLLEQGVAYRADFPEGREGDESAPHTIRLRIPQGRSLEVEDVVRGRLVFDSISLNDPVLLKSDGFPTYHLAVVVDDHEMEISHVFRGDDWIATFPIHVLLYEAFGWEMPLFGHLPNVLGGDGKKLSKRHGATTSGAFREQGYLAEALLNFTVLIGWSPGNDREIFSVSELIDAFSLEGIQRSGGVFDYAKLEWMNGQYISKLSVRDFLGRSRPFLEQAGLTKEVTPGGLAVVAPAVQERVRALTEVPGWVAFLFEGNQFQPAWKSAFGKTLDLAQAQTLLPELIAQFEVIPFAAEELEAALKQFASTSGIKVGDLFGLVRVAVLGSKATPPLGVSLQALGRPVVLGRLEAVAGLQPSDVAA